MATPPVDIKQPPDLIAAKLRDSAMMNKLVKQAVCEAVEKAQRLGFLPPASGVQKPGK
ncbi:hypothetical protein [Undibacterium curvum]|jgi:hypothetical protein|uniref:Uncharacterized protein n=1 Tax=Undibacterium curvum TaxID=2762294 RepID=A0ABR7A316_9BURK|nr:hypothetical protein [Undibacterium curvum]MBC3931305.1 hypothetical protein [Undibacterium curvum]